MHLIQHETDAIFIKKNIDNILSKPFIAIYRQWKINNK